MCYVGCVDCRGSASCDSCGIYLRLWWPPDVIHVGDKELEGSGVFLGQSWKRRHRANAVEIPKVERLRPDDLFVLGKSSPVLAHCRCSPFAAHRTLKDFPLLLLSLTISS